MTPSTRFLFLASVCLSIAAASWASIAFWPGLQGAGLMPAARGDSLGPEPNQTRVVVGAGDTVTFRYSMFNASGHPLLTNQFAVAQIINRSQPAYALRPVSDYAPTVMVLGELRHRFGERFESYFVGQPEGATFVTPVIPSNETITGIEGLPVTIPRRFGPFPVAETVALSDFTQRFPNATVGDVVQLNPRFHVVVDRLENGSVTYHFLLDYAHPLPYLALGHSAKLRTIPSDDGKTFEERIDIPVGAKFSRKNDRILDLTHGQYFVERVSDDAITLRKLRAPFFEHAFEDVYFVVELLQVEHPRDR